ncbi:MAG: putative RNA-binding protein 42 [Streblomastix strix]|uniref:Putative RNA-binding protein 42 n=1 Tax=Streblomastix strix TaxID=222440 RepID=A0A5J4VYV4_9EUKA|nr:MAG: putative RNA-binding protein 42 [Streblomastix strix]
MTARGYQGRNTLNTSAQQHDQPLLPQPAFTDNDEENNEQETVSSGAGVPVKKLKKKQLRYCGGKTWEDKTLLEWPENDFRMWVGDLGNDVTDDILSRAFGSYPSFQKAHVVRDIKTKKSKGYGFLSFGQQEDYLRAFREMNGKYVGSRPLRLRKSNWKERSYEFGKKKEQKKMY